MFGWKRKPQAEAAPVRRAPSAFSTHLDIRGQSADSFRERIFQRDTGRDIGQTVGMDANEGINSLKAPGYDMGTIPLNQLSFYSSYGFIGFQACAVIAQHWLVSKACWMPGKDAVRNGYEIGVDDGTEISPEVIDALKKADRKYQINAQMREFIGKGRMFGQRVALFRVKSSDEDYYKKPFNIDGVTAGSYQGIVQVDPYWIAPILDFAASADPTNPNFYEPTWWNINGKQVHRSHIMFFKTEDVADILKPTYFYGGVPVPQKIFERVYAAERTANEAPMLALTKRSTNYYTDLEQVAANQEAFERKMQEWAYLRDNYAVKLADRDDKIEQQDTTLSELDDVIMTSYQLVAAASEVPATKLLGTAPKGFNSTGEYDESSYHEMLEGLQANDLTPLVNRHHAMVMRSEIAPKLGIKPFSPTITWNPVDAMTAKELAELNYQRSQADKNWSDAGAIDGTDIRTRLINDPDSGYTGMNDQAPEETDDGSPTPPTPKPA